MPYRRHLRTTLPALLLVFAVACAPGDEQPAAEGSAGPLPDGATLPADHPPIGTAPGVASAPADAPTGLVRETMDSGGYTYALLDINGDEIWAAGPPTELAVDDQVALAGAMGMENFTAASLERTFDRILFVSGFVKR